MEEVDAICEHSLIPTEPIEDYFRSGEGGGGGVSTVRELGRKGAEMENCHNMRTLRTLPNSIGRIPPCFRCFCLRRDDGRQRREGGSRWVLGWRRGAERVIFMTCSSNMFIH